MRKFEAAEKEATKLAREGRDKGKKVVAEGKAKAREFGHDISANRDNPIVIGNAVLLGLGASLLG